MYFFKVELSLFDEEKETIFLIPNADTIAITQGEIPVFSENELTAHPKFLAFVKRTKTSIVDVDYELYSAKDVIFDTMNDEQFEELKDSNKLEMLDSNSFCITNFLIRHLMNTIASKNEPTE